MATRHVEFYRRERKALIETMGSKCSKCPRVDNLEFHHVYGRTWSNRDYSRDQRIRKLKIEFKQGLLQLLCSHCNKQIGKPKYDPRIDQF